jgi:hypothetical protein
VKGTGTMMESRVGLRSSRVRQRYAQKDENCAELKAARRECKCQNRREPVVLRGAKIFRCARVLVLEDSFSLRDDSSVYGRNPNIAQCECPNVPQMMPNMTISKLQSYSALDSCMQQVTFDFFTAFFFPPSTRDTSQAMTCTTTGCTFTHSNK